MLMLKLRIAYRVPVVLDPYRDAGKCLTRNVRPDLSGNAEFAGVPLPWLWLFEKEMAC
jgi:hypothetical protein